MPDREGNLTKEEADPLVKALNEKGVRGCPACKESPSPSLVTEIVYLAPARRDAGYPMLMVCCSNCGLTRLFSAAILGIRRPPDDK